MNKKIITALVLTLASFTARAGDLPDPTLTPGAINPDVTQENIGSTVCVKGWTTTVRPPAFYTNRLKRIQLRQYGYADTNPRDYEEDHLIPLSVGGNPTDPRNLWPEPRNSEWNADCVFRGSWTRVSHEGGQVFRAKLDSRSAATQGVSVFTLTAGFRSN